MAYSTKTVEIVKTSPKTLGNQLGRWAVHLDFPVARIAYITGVSRQTVYNWYSGGDVFVAYRPHVEALLKVFQTSTTNEEAWIKACKAFNIQA